MRNAAKEVESFARGDVVDEQAAEGHLMRVTPARSTALADGHRDRQQIPCPEVVEREVIVGGGRPGEAGRAESRHVPVHESGIVEVLDVEDLHKEFDTPAGRLAADRVNLRIRLAENQAFITVKGRDKSTAQGLARREYEAPWTAEGLGTSLSVLAELGVTAPGPPDDLDDHPVAVMARLGFRTIQERETFRRLRDVTRAAEGTVLAELAVDAVTFRVSGGSVRLHEVEIELRESGRAMVLQELAAALTVRWPELKPWPYSKVATGLAIEALLDEGRPVTVTGTIDVAPAAYHIIATHLGSPQS